MTKAQKLSLRLSEIRQRLNEIAGFDGDDLTDEIRSESDKLTREFRDSETQYRAAVTAESEDEERAREASGEVLDSETRERLALRGKVRVLDFVQAPCVAVFSLGLLPSTATPKGQAARSPCPCSSPTRANSGTGRSEPSRRHRGRWA